MLGMLAHARYIVREERQSPIQVEKAAFGLPTIEMTKMVVANRAKGEVLKAKDIKAPLVDVNMVDFIQSQFWAKIDRLNNLTGDIVNEEAE